jgi:hypothetical protein
MQTREINLFLFIFNIQQPITPNTAVYLYKAWI